MEAQQQQPKEKTTKKPLKSAANLRTIGTIILRIGIILGIITFLSTMYVDSGRYEYSKDMVFNPMCFVYSFGIIIPSVTIWAFAKAVADIVDNTSK